MFGQCSCITCDHLLREFGHPTIISQRQQRRHLIAAATRGQPPADPDGQPPADPDGQPPADPDGQPPDPVGQPDDPDGQNPVAQSPVAKRDNQALTQVFADPALGILLKIVKTRYLRCKMLPRRSQARMSSRAGMPDT